MMNCLVIPSTVTPLQTDWLSNYWPLLVQGFEMTMCLYATALFIGFCFGLVLAIFRQYGGPLSSRIATAYIETIRGTPLLVQIYLFYLLPYFLNATLTPTGPQFIDVRWSLSLFNITLLNHQTFTAMGTLGLNSAAYQAEYLRGAMTSIGGNQLMAARSVGMSKTMAIRHIIIPQSLRRAIPSWSNEAAYLPKYTVVASLISVNDLFQNASWIVSKTYIVLPVWLTVAVMFFAVISVISWVLDRVYLKTRIPM
jgi:polar amino acid transport system permease protein